MALKRVSMLHHEVAVTSFSFSHRLINLRSFFLAALERRKSTDMVRLAHPEELHGKTTRSHPLRNLSSLLNLAVVLQRMSRCDGTLFRAWLSFPIRVGHHLTCWTVSAFVQEGECSTI